MTQWDAGDSDLVVRRAAQDAIAALDAKRGRGAGARSKPTR
jgi:hypothetical protein